MSPALSPPSHHPSASTLVDYASGAGSSEHARVIAAHVAACPVCRAQVALAESVGGALLDALEPATMSDGALDRALAALDLPAPTPRPLTAAVRSDWISAPDEVLEAALKRRRWAAPGVWVAPISHDRATGRRSYLLRVAAGMAVPHHGHRGSELTVVLKGAFDDGAARFSAGDFAEVGEEVEHHPHVTNDGECICLIAADAPLIPLDWVGRVFQPFVRI